MSRTRLASMAFLGFSSGLPFLLSSSTLQAWMTLEGVDLTTLGLFSLVGLPYAAKPLWAPLMDAITPPFLGRRRGWILMTQVYLMIVILAASQLSPAATPMLTAVVALLLAFGGSSQDIVLDAYRTDILPPREHGPGISLWALGFRGGMLTAGALALVLGDQLGWGVSYAIMAATMGIGVITTLLVPEPELAHPPPTGFHASVIEPMTAFLARPHAIAFLVLICLYKLCDSYAASLGVTFLIRGVDFTATDVGVVTKGVGMVATMSGIICGGFVMVRLGLYRCLIAFGLLQALTNLMFVALAEVGHHYPLMVATVVVEKFAAGMGDVPFLALLMALCDARFTAFQYALLSSVPALGRTLVGASAGVLVEAIDWSAFFFITALAAIPALALAVKLREPIEALAAENPEPESAIEAESG